MSEDNNQTNSPPSEFDFAAYPRNTLFHERRRGVDRRRRTAPAGGDSARPTPPAGIERRAKKERRRRVDPTTFEKQYTEDEMEFMNAMQRFKELSGTAFPTYGDALKVAIALGYRKAVEAEPRPDDIGTDELAIIRASFEGH